MNVKPHFNKAREKNSNSIHSIRFLQEERRNAVNTLRKVISPLKYRRAQKGQVLILLVFGLIALIVVVGFAIDMGIWWWQTSIAHETARAGCVAAANSALIGGNAQSTFASVMNKNGIPTTAYSPKQGTGLGLKKGLELQSDGSWRAAVSWVEPTFLLNLVNVSQMPIFGRARCLTQNTGGSPIAVRKTALDYSKAHPGASYTILGNDPKWPLSDTENGNNFRGAVYLHMWCVPSSNQNCPGQIIFWPLTSVPPSSQTEKDLALDCFKGVNCNIQPPIGTRLPITNGTSAKDLAAAFESVHKVGDKILVLVYDGTVWSKGNSKNVVVQYYAVYQATKFSANSVEATLVGGPYSSLSQIPSNFLTRSREISWDYTGALP